MKHVIYGLSAVITTDDVADALIHYAAIVAQAQASDVVAVPTVDLAGYPEVTSIVLGPGVPVLVSGAPDDELETPHPDFVNDLTNRTRDLIADGPRRRP